MPVSLFMDHNVRRAITDGLRLRGVDVLTALQDDSHELPDPELLDRATALNRVLFTQDDDLLAIAHLRQRDGRYFPGVIYAHQLEITVRQCIDDLELLAQAADPDDLADLVHFLPLR